MKINKIAKNSSARNGTPRVNLDLALNSYQNVIRAAEDTKKSSNSEDLEEVLEVSKMAIGYQNLVQPVNFDRKKSRI